MPLLKRGRPKLPPKIEPTPKEQLVAIYLAKFVCTIPGCDDKMHLIDARHITNIILNIKEDDQD